MDLVNIIERWQLGSRTKWTSATWKGVGVTHLSGRGADLTLAIIGAVEGDIDIPGIVGSSVSLAGGAMALAPGPLGAVGVVLHSLGSLIKVVFSEESSQPPWLKEIRLQFNLVNEKLDRIENKLHDLEALIHWVPYKQVFIDIRRKIRAYRRQLRELPAPGDATWQLKKNKLLQDYNTNAGYDLGGKLFDFFTDLDALTKYKHYLENDRPKIINSMLASYGYLMEAAEMEMSFIYLESPSNRTSVEKEWLVKWCNRFENVELQFAKIDNMVKNAWSSQAKEDIIEFIKQNDNDRTANAVFATQLQRKLQEKFYWRSWIVIVYDKGEGAEYLLMKGVY